MIEIVFFASIVVLMIYGLFRFCNGVGNELRAMEDELAERRRIEQQ